VKFTYTVSMAAPEFLVPLAQAAEAVGYDTVAIADSIAYPNTSDSSYPYNPDGTREFMENKVLVEPMVAIAAMGAATSTIEFHTAVLKLPMRHPAVFAKQATSLAVMTGNRFVLGVGLSPWPDDYDIVGLPWAGRGRRFDECIDIVRGLSTGDYFEFHGECYDIPSIKLLPVPTEALRIIIGGHSDANLRRAARLDGWTDAGRGPDALVASIARMREVRRELGREAEPFEIYSITADSFSVDGIARLEELGVTHTGGGFGRFNPYGLDPDPETLGEKLDNLRRYADDVIAKVRG
jgi:alkanesulfonate monooxygenase SsuD/methylene tetrahydromethanopterin reductase-like flavin-dependent oxidoreductase (luciferase family)